MPKSFVPMEPTMEELNAKKPLCVDLNEFITCTICNGYLIDATTIDECLHSFCKTCLINHLKKGNLCPKCNETVHKTKPFEHIHPDPILQDIVYKVVPGLFWKEMERRKKMYQQKLEKIGGTDIDAKIRTSSLSGEERGEYHSSGRTIYSPNEMIPLSIQYMPEVINYSFLPLEGKASLLKCIKDDAKTGLKSENDTPTRCVQTNDQKLKVLDDKSPPFSSEEELNRKRYLRCPAGVMIHHLKKLIRNKFDLDDDKFSVEMFYRHDQLLDDYSILDLAYIYSWKRNGPLELFYKINDHSKDSSIDEEVLKLEPKKKIAPNAKNNDEKITAKEEKLVPKEVKMKKIKRSGSISSAASGSSSAASPLTIDDTASESSSSGKSVQKKKRVVDTGQPKNSSTKKFTAPDTKVSKISNVVSKLSKQVGKVPKPAIKVVSTEKPVLVNEPQRLSGFFVPKNVTVERPKLSKEVTKVVQKRRVESNNDTKCIDIEDKSLTLSCVQSRAPDNIKPDRRSSVSISREQLETSSSKPISLSKELSIQKIDPKRARGSSSQAVTSSFMPTPHFVQPTKHSSSSSSSAVPDTSFVRAIDSVVMDLITRKEFTNACKLIEDCKLIPNVLQKLPSLSSAPSSKSKPGQELKLMSGQTVIAPPPPRISPTGLRSFFPNIPGIQSPSLSSFDSPLSMSSLPPSLSVFSSKSSAHLQNSPFLSSSIPSSSSSAPVCVVPPITSVQPKSSSSAKQPQLPLSFGPSPSSQSKNGRTTPNGATSSPGAPNGPPSSSSSKRHSSGGNINPDLRPQSLDGTFVRPSSAATSGLPSKKDLSEPRSLYSSNVFGEGSPLIGTVPLKSSSSLEKNIFASNFVSRTTDKNYSSSSKKNGDGQINSTRPKPPSTTREIIDQLGKLYQKDVDCPKQTSSPKTYSSGTKSAHQKIDSDDDGRKRKERSLSPNDDGDKKLRISLTPPPQPSNVSSVVSSP